MRNGMLSGAITVAALAFTVAMPQSGQAAAGESSGRTLYLQYCGSCHGAGGKGDGVVAPHLTPRPADLTKIAKNHGGQFPFTATMRAIDGTATLRAHGDPVMPVWGEVWREQAGSSATAWAEVKGKLMLITEYLQSIQDPSSAP